jgi:multidrug resistance efflux pump
MKNLNEEKINNLKPGMKVKINIDAFEWKKHTLTQKFLDYINSNKDTIFTLKQYDDDGVRWTFEEDDMWLFYWGDLILL